MKESKFNQTIQSITSGLYHFVMLLRNPYLTRDETPEILIVGTVIPEERDWLYLKEFPGVYFIQADCTKDQELVRVGVKEARQIVVFSDPREWAKYGKETTMSDAKAV